LLRSTLKRWVPRAARVAVRDAQREIGALRWRGTEVHCPVCERDFRRFLPFGDVVRREQAQCPGCLALERHRLLWRWLRERTALFPRPHRLLHFAPERCFERRLSRLPGLDYVTADLDPTRATVPADITRMPFPDGSFDAVMAIDVLEHVAEEAAAMREVRRVLRPGGWALLRVPIDATRAVTHENPAVRTPEERAREYRSPHHLRLYGRDYPDRLRRAGFTVREDDFASGLDAEQARRQGIVPETIYLALR
jgi:hypothetical protein